MASEPPEDPPGIAAPFAVGSAPKAPKTRRRIIRARRPPRRQANSAGSSTEAPGVTRTVFNLGPASSGSDSSESVPSLASRHDSSSENDDSAILVPISNEGEFGLDNSVSDSESSYNSDDDIPLTGLARRIRAASTSEEVGISAFNVVSPLSVENRFFELADDDSDSSVVLSQTRPVGVSEHDIVSIGAGPTPTDEIKKKKSKRKKKNNKGSGSKNTDVCEPICSICIEPDQPSSRWNNLVILPCCGSALSDTDQPKEINFSTRFCSGCILKLVKVNLDKDSNEYDPWDSDMNNFPQVVFYKDNSMCVEEGEIIECPRCRVLICVKCEWSSNLDSDDSECDCSECRAERRRDNFTASRVDSISIVEPSFKSKVNFVGRKRGFAQLLWRIAFLPRNIITDEGLGGDEESARISKLTGWGVLKKNGNVYTLKSEDQDWLLRLFETNVDSSNEEKEDENWNLFQSLLVCMLLAVFDLFKKLQFVRAVRMLNHIGLLHHCFANRLPYLPPNTGQGFVLTGLNVFCLGIFLRVLRSLAVNGGLYFGGIFIICRTLRFSSRQANRIKKDVILACLIAIMAAYFAHTLSSYFHYLSLVWNKLISLATLAKGIVLY